MIDPISAHLGADAGIHGTVMLMYHGIATGSGSPQWPWAVSLSRFKAQLDFLASNGWQTLTMADLLTLTSPGPIRSVVITFDDGYENNLMACEELAKRNMRASWFIVTGSIGREPLWADPGRPGCQLLDAGQLQEMHRAGMEIGSHTVTHRRLTTLSADDLTTELTQSRAHLADVLGAPPRSLAYPYGDFDARIEEATQAAGYTQACTTQSGWSMREPAPFRRRRLTIFNHDTPSSFARKLYFGDNEAGGCAPWIMSPSAWSSAFPDACLPCSVSSPRNRKHDSSHPPATIC